MEISFSGSVSQEELAVIVRQIAPVKKMNVAIGLGLMALMNLAVFGTALQKGPAVIWSDQLIVTIPFAVGVVAFLLMVLLLPALTAQTAFRQNQAISKRMWGSASAEQIVLNSGPSKVELGWAAYPSARLYPELVLLYQGNHGANFFPRSFFETEADWLAFRELVLQNVPHHSIHPQISRLVLPVRNARLWLLAGFGFFVLVTASVSFWTSSIR
jgi:hypothetical protein